MIVAVGESLGLMKYLILMRRLSEETFVEYQQVLDSQLTESMLSLVMVVWKHNWLQLVLVQDPATALEKQ